MLVNNLFQNIHKIKNELCFRELHTFLKEIWNIVETKQFADGWHIQAMCEHLQAVERGYINDLIITMPPRHSKSLTISTLRIFISSIEYFVPKMIPHFLDLAFLINPTMEIRGINFSKKLNGR